MFAACLAFATALADTTHCGVVDRPVADGVDFVDMTRQFQAGIQLPTPVVGTASFKETYGNYTFYFKNESNAGAFSSQPEDFIPKYGCYCGYAMSGVDMHCREEVGFCLGPLCPLKSDGYAFFEDPATSKKRITCFLETGARSLFESNLDANIKSADANFQKELAIQNTQTCFNTDTFNGMQPTCTGQ
eukprot:TRINITY_DN37015_c0_g1_i1.p1 TRINITY_DN37015_c0_g1~~TRINITY_DN37015_c0_g1_i1.p1  ORF type:complete len:195 (+),score=31.79 TRINITY_DN37015_c0_g1_i1:22-585(+)